MHCRKKNFKILFGFKIETGGVDIIGFGLDLGSFCQNWIRNYVLGSLSESGS